MTSLQGQDYCCFDKIQLDFFYLLYDCDTIFIITSSWTEVV